MHWHPSLPAQWSSFVKLPLLELELVQLAPGATWSHASCHVLSNHKWLHQSRWHSGCTSFILQNSIYFVKSMQVISKALYWTSTLLLDSFSWLNQWKRMMASLLHLYMCPRSLLNLMLSHLPFPPLSAVGNPSFDSSSGSYCPLRVVYLAANSTRHVIKLIGSNSISIELVW